MCEGKVKYYICDGRTFRESHPKPDSMPILMADQMPRYDFGVGIYGGYWPDGIAVKNPYCKCQQFGQCNSPLLGNRSDKDCFIGHEGNNNTVLN